MIEYHHLFAFSSEIIKSSRRKPSIKWRRVVAQHGLFDNTRTRESCISCQKLTLNHYRTLYCRCGNLRKKQSMESSLTLLPFSISLHGFSHFSVLFALNKICEPWPRMKIAVKPRTNIFYRFIIAFQVLETTLYTTFTVSIPQFWDMMFGGYVYQPSRN